MTMNPISINEYLSNNNPWSKRLLGLSDFQKKRDILQVEKEYNLDKYAKLLEFNLKTIEEYKIKEFEIAGLKSGSIMPISFGDAIFNVPLQVARNLYYGLIKSKIEKYSSTNICELGCGYGYNLSYLSNKVYGGEYSKNAVKLGVKLGMEVSEFNYYETESYNLIKPDTTVFTTHSIEQIPDATVIIKSLEKNKSKINYVIHFEPTVAVERSTLFGLMRNKYMELNDYNRNLIEVLKSNSNVEILELEYDIFGLVPLNSSNLIVWKFKK